MDALCRLLTAWFMPEGLAARLARWVMAAVVGLLLVAAIWVMLTGGKAREAQARLDHAMAGAAAANAIDAVSIVQQRATSEDAIERTVIHAQSAIAAASDAADADAAGRDGLCAVSAGFCPAARLQQPGSR